jgi:hypothetical protein
MRRQADAAASVTCALLLSACSSPSDQPAAGPADAAPAVVDATTSNYKTPTEAGATTTILYGEAGAPAPCASHPNVPESAIRACVLRTSCISDQPPFTLSDCIAKNLIDLDDKPDCVKNAPDCAQMNACVDNGFFKGCAFGDHGGHGYGSVFVDCDQGVFYDCAKRGLECYVDDPDAGTATSFGCIGRTRFDDPVCESAFNNAGSCSTPTPSSALACFLYASTPGQCVPQDDSGVPYDGYSYCYLGLQMRVNCASLGKTCVDSADGARCKLPASQCSSTNTQSCVLSNLHECTATGRLEAHDCTANGLQCASASGTAGCVTGGCTLDDAKTCRESCDGPYADICVGGARLTVDCRKYGFDRCQTYTSTKAIYHGDYALCVPY